MHVAGRASMPPTGIFDPEVLRNPYPYLARLRDTDRVHRIEGTRIHLVSRYDDVREAVRRPEDFSSHLREVLALDTDGSLTQRSMDGDGTLTQVLATADDPVHRAHRTLLMSALSTHVRALSGFVASRTEELWDDVATRTAQGVPADLVPLLADPLPLSVVARLVGLPEDELPQISQWILESTELLGGVVPADRVDLLVLSVSRLWSYLENLLDARLAAGGRSAGDDLLGLLAREVGEEGLDASTAVLVLIQLLGAGSESTSALIGSLLRTLAERPDVHRRLHDEPDLVSAFVDEVLRLESPFRGHYRSVARPCWLAGVPLVPGDHLLLLWGSANRDERRFAGPDDLDLDRAGVRGHLAFGHGMHFCAGSALARLEASAVVSKALAACESITIEEARWVPSVFVRRHDRLRMRLVPRRAEQERAPS